MDEKLYMHYNNQAKCLATSNFEHCIFLSMGKITAPADTISKIIRHEQTKLP